ncbi:MAG TPA: enoyl-CoA hydratase-related protein [Caulobacteraceae bacterium]|nr:enoyl-CoA hydratase-related protein [Caulobacteraceae bacterium]
MTNPIADPLVDNVDTDAHSDLVRIEATPEGVATITLNSPQTKNAFDDRVIAALRQAFETMHGAEGVRIVFLRGEGGTFSAGANLEWMARAAELSEADNRDDAMAMAAMLKALWDIPALTVAVVEGGAFGGGAGLAAACDVAIAVDSARFSFSEVRLGLVAATISPYVVRAIGPRHARALFATGRVFDAAHAEKIGLVSEVVAASDLEAVKARLASEMMAAAPGAVADSKRLVDDVFGRHVDHGLMETTARRIAARRVSDEGQEGVRAFLARRKPNWTG